MKQKQVQLEANCDSIEVLILGNSHAGDGLDPNSFKFNAFNVAQGFQSLYFDMEITKKYLTKMPQLKYVLISADYHSLYITHEPNRDFMYAHYYNIDYPGSNSYKSNISLLFFGYGFKNGISMILKQPAEVIKGWTKFKGTNYAELNSVYGKNRVELFNKMIGNNLHNRDEILKQLNSFIVFLKSKNITPVLYTLPCHAYYNDNLDATIMTQNLADIQNLCSRNDIRYLNFLYEKLPDDDFYNVDHLNEKGALKYSTILSDSISMIKAQK